MIGKYVVVYDVNSIASGHMPEKTRREYIKDLILKDKAILWEKMEPYFVPPGKEGRRDYDHAEAIGYLKRDSKAHAREKKMPDPLENLNTAALVPDVLKVLGMIGFVVKNGKIIGTKTSLEENDLEAAPPRHASYEHDGGLLEEDSEEGDALALAA